MFAVFFGIAMNSVNKGVFDHMENGMISSFIGFAQIHGEGYWEDQTLDYAFINDKSLNKIVEKYHEIDDFIPRLESFALTSNNSITRGSQIIGIDPAKEDALTNVSAKIVEGSYLSMNDNSALVAQGLAELLKLGVGDTIALTSQGFHGVNAAGLYVIKGLVKFPSPELNKQMVYLPLPVAQNFFGAEDRITSLVVNTNKPNKIKSTVKNLKDDFGEEYEIMDYQELIPDLIQARQFKEAGQTFMLIILYAIITFGIFGTILMMVKERQYEFGVLTAIGMKRHMLGLIVWLETIFIGFIGAIGGIAMGGSLAYYLKTNPVPITGEAAAAYEEFGIEPLIMASTDSSIFINQALTVFIIVTLLAIYPMLTILKLKPIEAMRN
jgi:ABC-type lipoprotein release transport system permease subunit